MYKILFVCTGNICRSPTAEGVMQHLLSQQDIQGVSLDSAGTHSYHVGEPPDPRSIAAAQKRGIELAHLRARKVTAADFDQFNLILACDQGHYQNLQVLQPSNSRAQLELYLPYVGIAQPKDIPDPYYGSHRDFEYVLDLLQQASEKLMRKVVQAT